MRHAKLGTVPLLALVFLLIAIGALRADQQSRVGKYFCFIENTAGIQHGAERSPYVGPIKPLSEKLFVEIKEYPISKDWRREICEHAFGLLNAPTGLS